MNFKKPFFQVPTVIYGDDSFYRLNEIIPNNSKNILIILDNKLDLDFSFLNNKFNYYYEKFNSTENEPYTSDIDSISLIYKDKNIDLIIGIGGGSTMDVAKSVSILIPVIDKFSAEDFQGWDLVNHQPIFKIGIPTIPGSGSEASRTAVLNNGIKKQGINSHASMFNSIILDPLLSKTVDKLTEFYSAMDCYIHSVESLEGSFITDLSREYAKLGLKISKERYLDLNKNSNMTLASYFGGVSIVNSEVGVCHALSYGLSIEYGIRHGLANCLIFNHLEEFYGNHVIIFKKMLNKNKITLPKNICNNISTKKLNNMISSTYLMKNPLLNALGKNFKNILSPKKIESIYKKI